MHETMLMTCFVMKEAGITQVLDFYRQKCDHVSNEVKPILNVIN